MPYIHHYPSINKWFHWIIGVGIVAMLGFGYYMEGLESSPMKFTYYGWHKSIGIIILALVIVRVIVRIRTKTPPLPRHMSLWQRISSHISHALLYIMMLYMPLTGWLMSSSAGYDVSIFGSPAIPNLVGKNKDMAAWFNNLHEIGLWVFVALIIIHAGAAFIHHFYYKDDVLLRMLPAKKNLQENDI